MDKMNFKPFKEKFQSVFPGYAVPSDAFLSWFIGFVEGDGSFVISNRKHLSVIVVQGIANKDVLYVIQKNLNMGHIIKQGPRIYRLIIQKKAYIELICLLFNGNIVLPSRKTQFNKFLIQYNTNPHNAPIPYISSNVLPSLHDSWLLGFTEAEGCFTICFLGNSNAFRTRYIISQKGAENLPILSHLIKLFYVGTVEGHSQKDNYSFIVSGLKNVMKIYNYFDNVQFLGVKGLSYEKFKLLNAKIQNKEHLNPTLRTELTQMSKDINSIPRKIK